MIPRRPDDREPHVVWGFVVKAFGERDFPDVSFALGSDWGMGSRVLSAAQYRAKAYAMMTDLYGPPPADLVL